MSAWPCATNGFGQRDTNNGVRVYVCLCYADIAGQWFVPSETQIACGEYKRKW